MGTMCWTDYAYDMLHPHAVSAFDGNEYEYDANGNQTARIINGQSFELDYDAEGHLMSVTGQGINAALTGVGVLRREKAKLIELCGFILIMTIRKSDISRFSTFEGSPSKMILVVRHL